MYYFQKNDLDISNIYNLASSLRYRPILFGHHIITNNCKATTLLSVFELRKNNCCPTDNQVTISGCSSKFWLSVRKTIWLRWSFTSGAWKFMVVRWTTVSAFLIVRRLFWLSRAKGTTKISKALYYKVILTNNCNHQRAHWRNPRDFRFGDFKIAFPLHVKHTHGCLKSQCEEEDKKRRENDQPSPSAIRSRWQVYRAGALMMMVVMPVKCW